MTELYSSGTWYVSPGCEEQFVERWTELISWSRQTFPAMAEAHLLQDQNLPGHFVSFATWTNPEDRTSWKRHPEFEVRFKAAAALCDKARGADYEQVSSA
jgi:heme-degrading monooxygenase HmoA